MDGVPRANEYQRNLLPGVSGGSQGIIGSARRTLRALLFGRLHVIDWILCLGILCGDLYADERIEPHKRYYEEDDATLMYPFNYEPLPLVPILNIKIETACIFLLPWLTFGLSSCLYVLRRKGGAGDQAARLLAEALVRFHHGVLATFQATAITSLVKVWTMLYVGREKPHFLTLLAMEDPPEDKLRDAHESYPSGHAAYMFAVFTVLALHVACALRVFAPVHDRNATQQQDGAAVPDEPRAPRFPTLRLLAVLATLSPAWLIAIHRIRQYAHHPSDVNAGILIGSFSGAIAFLAAFEAPWATRAGAPRVCALRGLAREDDAASEGEPAYRYLPPVPPRSSLQYAPPHDSSPSPPPRA
ncbi:unnamed protein product [Pedinophyceae sp. YPF-701]|nr:unnamed protein product [Pedinophyceae sp. YPF-701]